MRGGRRDGRARRRWAERSSRGGCWDRRARRRGAGPVLRAPNGGRTGACRFCLRASTGFKLRLGDLWNLGPSDYSRFLGRNSRQERTAGPKPPPHAQQRPCGALARMRCRGKAEVKRPLQPCDPLVCLVFECLLHARRWDVVNRTHMSLSSWGLRSKSQGQPRKNGQRDDFRQSQC